MLKKICLCFVLLIVFMFCGCSEETPKEVADVEDNDDLHIGMSFDSFVIERWTKDKEIFVASAQTYGAKVNVQNASGDLNTQIEQIRYLINKKMDVIVIIAVDSYGLSNVVNEARNAGIKVIAYDRLINNADINLYISFDNKQVGTLMASSLVNVIGDDGKYLMLSGPTTDNNVKMVEEGFVETLAKSNAEIKAAMNAVNWKAEYAYEFLEQNQSLIDNISGIMCGNDNIATQAIRFLAERGYAGKIPVVGQDADLEACQRIVEGTQLMTVYKPVEELAKTAADCAINLAQGRDITTVYNTETINNGSYKCPYINLPPVAVNKENIDDIIIKEGFHLREEVYLNIKK